MSDRIPALMAKIALVYNTIAEKNDTEVSLVLKTDKHVQPYIVRCDARSKQGTDPEAVLQSLLDELLTELNNKAKITQHQVQKYQKVLSQLGN